MDVQRYPPQRTENRRLYQQPFVSYSEAYSNYDTNNIDQSFVSLCCSTNKEKVLHRTNMVVQSKLKSSVERLNLQKKITTKHFRYETFRFRQRRKVFEDLQRHACLNVGCPTRSAAAGQRGSKFRSKSIPSVANSNQLTCIIAPSTNSSSIFRLPFNEPKQKSKMTNCVKSPKKDTEGVIRLDKEQVGVTEVKTWMPFSDQDADAPGASCKEKIVNRRRIRSHSMQQHQHQQQWTEKRKTSLDVNSRQTLERKSSISVTSAYGAADETAVHNESVMTSSFNADSSQFEPIDRDECVKIVRKVKLHLQTPTITPDSAVVPPKFASSAETRSSARIPYTKGGWCHPDTRLTDTRPRRPDADHLSGMLKDERSRYAVNEACLVDFMQHLILPASETIGA